MGYCDTYIYVLQFDYVFQYMFAWHNEVYMDRIEMKPRLWRAILALLGIIPNYTKQQIAQAEQVVLSGAMKTIDELKNKKKAKKIPGKTLTKPKNTECMWQTRFLGEKELPHYHCITHDKYIPMEDGKRPEHD